MCIVSEGISKQKEWVRERERVNVSISLTRSKAPCDVLDTCTLTKMIFNLSLSMTLPLHCLIAIVLTHHSKKLAETSDFLFRCYVKLFYVLPSKCDNLIIKMLLIGNYQFSPVIKYNFITLFRFLRKTWRMCWSYYNKKM